MADKKTNNKPASIDLTKAYQTATIQITDIIEKSKPATTYDLQLIIHKRLNQVTFELDKLNSEAIMQSSKKGLKDGQAKMTRHMNNIFNGRSFTEKDLNSDDLDNKNRLIAKAILDDKQQRKIQDATYRQNYLDVRSNLMGLRMEIDKTIKSTIKNLAKDGNNTVLNVQKVMAEKFKQEGVFKVTFSNGAKVGFDAYTNMVARTARTESNNLYSERICNNLDTKLVKCLSSAVTCPVCGVYQDRVFCIDASDMRFPALRDGQNAPLKHGYSTIHPNCRCEFLPYFEELQKPEELARDIAFSNRPFEDSRTREQQKDYQEWQAKNRQLRDESNEYNSMQAVLKDKMPYETLGGFRRAKRAGSSTYDNIKKEYKYAVKYSAKDKETTRLLHENDVKYIQRISDNEVAVKIDKPRRIIGLKKHAIDNLQNKTDRKDMTHDKAQEIVKSSKLVIYQESNHTFKYLADNGYVVLNMYNELVTAVPQRWRKKYDKYLKETWK